MTARSLVRWEQRVLEHATRCVFTSPGAMQWCAEQHPEAQRSGRLTVIENGYDETAFSGMPRNLPRVAGRPLVLLHSGLLYPEGRDPVPFFTALARMKASGHGDVGALRVVLRASGSESAYASEIKRLGLDELVALAPPLAHHEALAEQCNADALLVFQGAMYDRQIPAKVYEYLRTGRPIFALTTDAGDTAAVLRQAGVAHIAPIDDAVAIERELGRFVESLANGSIVGRMRVDVARWSRRARTEELAHLLDLAAS